MKDMLHMGLFLFVIAAIAGTLLAYTESVTAPLILENRQKVEELARLEVLPGSTAFANASFFDATASQTFNYSAGFSSTGELTGVVIKVAPKGYAGPIEMVLGLDKSGRVSGYKILSQKETPGLGTKLADPVFSEPFKKLVAEKATPVFLVKKDSGDVDAITAATISSRAFCTGVREAVSIFQKIQPQLGSLVKPVSESLAATSSTPLPTNPTSQLPQNSESTLTGTNAAPEAASATSIDQSDLETVLSPAAANASDVSETASEGGNK